MRKFLTARWQDLIMVNYEVAPSILAGLVPDGVELDFHEGRCYVSLVGFMFLNTRVLGIPVPFHCNFEEVNLRFYVARKTANETRRGVVFVKEIVPRYAIAAVARIFYEEPYEAWKMGHDRTETVVSYSWQKGGHSSKVSIEIGENLGVPVADSHGEFIIEHYWGYTKRTGGRTDEYKVEHPKWELFSVDNPIINVDFTYVYGEGFAFLKDLKPYSVFLAKGSEVAVYKGEEIQ